MIKSAQEAKQDAYNKAMKPPTEVTAITIKNKLKRSIVSFLRSLNPANWFNEFSDIKITLEEFESIRKIKQEESIAP